ncbi:MAG: hypothetical protein KGY66_05950 [Candidatus Thermoplasmatota archaeon]|nr:hypothetical protein [Candidatus Thermoplasmatota archaeon]MBS3790442.1 hypothetical protein [Candidatus Thermoplasmatota archaeon]
MLISQKLAISMAIWTLLMLTLIGGENVELFVIMILIGLLIIRELSSIYIRPSLAVRLDVFVQIGIVFFIGVVMRRILSILELI